MRTCFLHLSHFVRQKKRQEFRSCLKFLRVVEITFVEWICVLRATLQICLSWNFGRRSRYLLRSPRREDIYGNHHIYCRGNYRYLVRLYGCNLLNWAIHLSSLPLIPPKKFPSYTFLVSVPQLGHLPQKGSHIANLISSREITWCVPHLSQISRTFFCFRRIISGILPLIYKSSLRFFPLFSSGVWRRTVRLLAPGVCRCRNFRVNPCFQCLFPYV